MLRWKTFLKPSFFIADPYKYETWYGRSRYTRKLVARRPNRNRTVRLRHDAVGWVRLVFADGMAKLDMKMLLSTVHEPCLQGHLNYREYKGRCTYVYFDRAREICHPMVYNVHVVQFCCWYFNFKFSHISEGERRRRSRDTFFFVCDLFSLGFEF